MRFLSFGTGTAIRPGLVLDQAQALDLRRAMELVGGEGRFDSILELVRGGQRALDAVAALLANPPDEARLELSGLALKAPLPIPEQIRDFANYEGHCLKAMQASMRLRAAGAPDPEAALERLRASGGCRLPPVWYELPLYYKGNRFAANGHEGEVVRPPFARNLDYEMELAAVIGAQGKDIPAAKAQEHIFGYTIFNDFSARDVQARWEGQFRMGPAKAKDFDGGNCFGPWIVTRDELPDPYSLEMVVRVNGEERGRACSGGAQHSFERCIEQVSRSETIHPGEIFGLGTPENGCGFESLNWLDDGDLVEIEIEGIGALRNRVVGG